MVKSDRCIGDRLHLRAWRHGCVSDNLTHSQAGQKPIRQFVPCSQRQRERTRGVGVSADKIKNVRTTVGSLYYIAPSRSSGFLIDAAKGVAADDQPTLNNEVVRSPYIDACRRHSARDGLMSLYLETRDDAIR